MKQKPRRRQSPGGQILCYNVHLNSRRRFNAALRLGLRPVCKECGSKDLQPQSAPGCGWEIRGGRNKQSLAGFQGGGLRLVWTR